MPPRQLSATRACDSCRRRKVKCDTLENCANCRISDLTCQYTSTPRKRGPKVSRTSRATRASHDIAGGARVRSPDEDVLNSGDMLWPSPVSGASGAEPNRPRDETATPHSGHFANTPVLTGTGADGTPTAISAQAIRDGLMGQLSATLLSFPVHTAANECIDLYMQYIFPTAPMVHELTLRASSSTFLSATCATQLFIAHSLQEEVEQMRAFALLTALCASVASIIPDPLLPYRQILARPCLDASRDMLKIFEDFDVEHPNQTSLAIRILHSTALQQITGKTALAYHSLGQCGLIIRNMRLYNEDSLKIHDPLEAQLLRFTYWQMYAADNASACLDTRPCILHELLFNGERTIHPNGEPPVPLLDVTNPLYEGGFEARLTVGFHFIPRLWSSAANLMLDMKSHRRGSKHANKTTLIQAYMEFQGIMDELPHWLQAANIIVSRDDGEAAQFQKTAFWVQRCTVLVIFQCLRLVILQQCIDSKLWDIMGLNDQAFTLPMTKIGMVHDFVQTLDDIPFVYLQVKGEPTVERLRRVGSVLLEMIDSVTDETINGRAKHYFARLLDLLARLDSKSSDVLADVRGLRETVL